MKKQVTGWLVVFLLAGCVLTGISCKKDTNTLEGRSFQVDNSAYWGGYVWFIETGGEIEIVEYGNGDKSAYSRLVRMEPKTGAKFEAICELDSIEPSLLAGKDRLWIVSTESVGYFKDCKYTTKKNDSVFENVSIPFLYQGKPAFIAVESPGYRLMVYENEKWNPAQKLRIRLPQETDKCVGKYLRAFEQDGQLHVFCQVQFSPPVYYHKGLPLAENEDQVWERVASAGGHWTPAFIGNRPAVFYHTTNNGDLAVVGVGKNGEMWEDFFAHKIGWDIGLGICPTGEADDFVLLRRILPLDVEILGIKKGKPVWSCYGSGDTNLVEVVVKEMVK